MNLLEEIEKEEDALRARGELSEYYKGYSHCLVKIKRLILKAEEEK